MAASSRSSSLGDVYYTYPPSHSATSSSVSTASVGFPAPPTTAAVAQDPARRDNGQHQQPLPPLNTGVHSFARFRSQIPTGLGITSPILEVDRESLPSPARPVSSSTTIKGSPRLAELTPRPQSLRSPSVQQGTTQRFASSFLPPIEQQSVHRAHPSFTNSTSDERHHDPNYSHLAHPRPSSSTYGDSRRSSIPVSSRYAHEQKVSHAPRFSVTSLDFESGDNSAERSNTGSMGVRTRTAAPPQNINLDAGVKRTLTDDSLSSIESMPPKSPGGMLGNFFGWKRGPDSPATAFSDGSLSPMPGIHRSYSMDNPAPRGTLSPPAIEVQRAGPHHRSEYFDNDETPILLGSPETNAHVRELEKELTQVSTELAESIKREMELEDEIERIRERTPSDPSGDNTRRGSDYFSDSGTSAGHFTTNDPESKLGQLEQKVRKIEQEKAQVKIEMASRLQVELSRRRDLEIMVHKLEKQFQAKMDEDEQRGSAEDRVDELEKTLEDTRRLLSQERQAKASFEDLYTATKGDLERHINQHDNLRDEVVPQLKARIDGLESEAADTQALVYENTRMQQELHAFKSRMHARFGSIAEEDDGSVNRGLARSGSLARNASRRGVADGGRQRSGSVSAAVTMEGVKEIEDQRDALHKALKLLIIRSEKQQKEHELAVKRLTSARDAAERSSPTRSAYHREVSFLKEEVATLRKRTEDALEQKWQYEKGLSGIKMDLDRAELETRGLRIILQEHDIFGSSQKTLLSGGQNGEAVDQRLQQSISSAETERDQARKVAREYRERAQSVQDGSSAELNDCAKRMDDLADQLEKQVQSNIELRARLAKAVARGEREQRESNGKIGEMQKRLASMEDSVLAAQQHSETTLGTHEAEVRKLEEASSPALQRLRISIPNPNHRRLTPLSPLVNGGKSPKVLGKKLSDNSLLEVSKTQMLERKVKELEALLREAEEDMQDVVQKVNQSQVEVAELQTERDSAFNQMKKLQTLIVQEREKAERLMKK